MKSFLRQEASEYPEAAMRSDNERTPYERALLVLLAARTEGRDTLGVPADEAGREAHLSPEATDVALDALTTTRCAAVVPATGGYRITAHGMHRAAGLLDETDARDATKVAA
jgi:hypothetical protein